LGVPVINIGSRQNRRDRGNNVVDVSYDKNEIIATVKSSIAKGKAKPSDVYGGGEAGQKIADLLVTLPLQFHKTISY
jgi:UDP-N-acetylglucosamine 2-epimerase